MSAFRGFLSNAPTRSLPDLQTGLVALRLAAIDDKDENLKLAVYQDEQGNSVDEEYALVDGTPRKVIGSRHAWERQARQDRPGERAALKFFVEENRYKIAHAIFGRYPTNSQMDAMTDFVQWMGTRVGESFCERLLAAVQEDVYGKKDK